LTFETHECESRARRGKTPLPVPPFTRLISKELTSKHPEKYI